MGKPGWENPTHPIVSAIGSETRGSETSQYPEEKKPKGNSLSSGERKGKSLNHALKCMGSWGKDGGENPQGVKNSLSSRMTLERAAREGESPVGERERTPWSLTPSTTRPR